MTGAFLRRGQIRTIGFTGAIVFGRRKRSDAWYRLVGRHRHRRRLFHASAAIEYVIEEVAQLFLLLVIRSLGALTFESVAVRANVIDAAAFILRIGVRTGFFRRTIDR